jgi:hypothetical protein
MEIVLNRVAPIIPISINWFGLFSYSGDEYSIRGSPVWAPNVKSTDVRERDLTKWVENQMPGDLKRGFIKIKKADFKEVTVSFDCARWLRENFLKEPVIEYHLPTSLVWSFKNRLPDVLTSHVPWNTLKKYVEDRFKNFFRSYNKSGLKGLYVVLRKAKYDWFTYEADLQMNKIYMKVRPIILITLMVGAKVAKDVLLGAPDRPWSNRHE